MLMIRLDNVSKVYPQGKNEVTALDRVSLEVPRGQFLSVMGPSGSGKSTMLHLIGGLDTASGGEVYIDGRALSGLSDDDITIFRRRKIGFVFQFFNLLPTLSAEENVALPLLLDGKRMKDVAPRVQHLIELVGLTDRRHHRPDELSGGQMQRVAIARALVTQPVLMLADEPTGNLDTKTGDEVLGIVRAATERDGQTVILVTHDTHAASYGDRTIEMKDGRIVGDRGR